VAAASLPGHLRNSVSAPTSPEFDWAISSTFDSAEDLNRWLDSAARSTTLIDGAGRGFQRQCADLILPDAAALPTGTSVFEHQVGPGLEEAFVQTQARLVALSRSCSGFEGAALVRPDDDSAEWLSILRFRTDEQLAGWLNSAERRAALPELRAQLTQDFSVLAHSTPFGSILRVQDGITRVTPEWKTAMLVLLVLYPTVMTLSRFLGPVLDDLGAEPWLSMWLSQIVSVALMTWFLMPTVTGWFRRWLDPVEGAGVRTSVIGAAVVAGVYAVTLTIFASVTWLQFWDYLD
jgi:antibiotic biosynthesis monooxygenase (ABM) superfamily enzyme